MKGLFDIFAPPSLSLRMAPAAHDSGVARWSLREGRPEIPYDLEYGNMLAPGWYRLAGQSVESSGPDGAAIVFPGEGRVLRLPFGINGKLDHVFFLPFSPESIGFIAAREVASSGEISLSLQRISPIAARFLMLGRLLNYLFDEGTIGQLDRLKAFGTDHILASPAAACRLERVYGRVKQRMVLRSLPLREYDRWRSLNEASGQRPPVAGRAACPATVIVDVRCGDARAVQSTLESLAGQTVPPERVLLMGDAVREAAFVGSGLDVRAAERASALGMVKTRCMMILLAGDVLAQSGLEMLTDKSLAVPEAVCVTCDEDAIGPDGAYGRPAFKPEFDPILQAAADSVGRACLHALEHVRSLLPDGEISAEGMRWVVAGAGGRVAHVPHVLLHCPQSDDRFIPPVPFSGVSGDVPKVSVIIPTRDMLKLLRPCVESIASGTAYPDFEIVIVDNGSHDAATLEYLGRLKEAGQARVIRADMPFNYSRLNNIGSREARGDVLVFLNNDIEIVDETWLSAMVSWVWKLETGTVGARLLYPDGRLQHAGLVMGLVGVAGHPWKGCLPEGETADFRLRYPRTVSANTGACLAVRKDNFVAVGGFDESLAVAFNDVDLCLRVQEAGLRNVWTPEATLVHHESVSRGRNDTVDKRTQFQAEKRIMRKRWGRRLKEDPYYNPNLTYEVEDGGLALFPRQLYPRSWWRS